MRRLKVLVGMLVAGTVLAIGLVLFVSRPGEIERLLRSAGPVRSLYSDLGRFGRPSVQLVQLTVEVPQHPASETEIFKELSRRGYKNMFSGRLKDCYWSYLFPSGKTTESPVQFFSYPDHCRIVYLRSATTSERLVHRVKAALNLGD